jgi:hypothetical protein
LVKEDVRLRLQVVRQHLERGTRTSDVCRVSGSLELSSLARLTEGPDRAEATLSIGR